MRPEMQVITRNEAQAQGLKRFYTGVACKHGHDAERFVANGGCVSCVNRSTPHKQAYHLNVVMPERGFLFETTGTRDEYAAALRYVQHMRWHETALAELRKDPAVMAQFKASVTADDLAKARAVLNQHELAQMRDRKAMGLT